MIPLSFIFINEVYPSTFKKKKNSYSSTFINFFLYDKISKIFFKYKFGHLI